MPTATIKVEQRLSSIAHYLDIQARPVSKVRGLGGCSSGSSLLESWEAMSGVLPVTIYPGTPSAGAEWLHSAIRKAQISLGTLTCPCAVRLGRKIFYTWCPGKRPENFFRMSKAPTRVAMSVNLHSQSLIKVQVE